MKTYNVEIIEIRTGKVIETIGKNMSERQAEKREMTGLSRINTNHFFVRTSKVA